jgi:4-amino-4-deoxy-L-arabinose transferase-like glycosyltransferase
MQNSRGSFSSSVHDPSDGETAADAMRAGSIQSMRSAFRVHVSWKMFRSIALALAAVLLVWLFFDLRFRDFENNPTALLCLPLAASVCLLVLAITVGSEWMRAGMWFSLGLLGQAATLQLINAGWQLRYQHYKSFAEITDSTFGTVLLGFLVVQAGLVVLGLRPWLHALVSWCGRNLRLWQALLISSIFLLSTTTLSRDIGDFIQEWFFATLVQVLALLTVLVAVLAIPSDSAVRAGRVFKAMFSDRDDGHELFSMLPDRYVLAAAIFVTILTSTLCIYSYERHPHVPDEIAYLFQARIFATGSLTLPAPLVPEAFDVYLMNVIGDRWYPVTPPGWPLVLAIGELLGFAWLVNPFLAGLNVLLVYVFLREIYSTGLSRAVIFLLALSPWYLFLGMSFMTHMFSLTCALIAAIGVALSRRTGSMVWALAGGFSIGMLSMVRPLEAVAISGLLGLWSIGLGGRRLPASGVASLVLGSIIASGIGLAYNAALTGEPLHFPINSYTDDHFGKNSNAYGFGPDRGMGWQLDPYPGHGPADALVNTNLNVSATNTELFGWSIGSFLLIAIGVFFGRLERSDLLMLAVIAAIYILHFFYYFSGGPDFGARYWFLMIVPLIVLAARGAGKLAARLDEEYVGGGTRVYAAVLGLCITSFVTFVPWRAMDKYQNFRGMRPDLRYLADDYDFGKSLVLIEGNKHPDYDSALIYNPVDPTAKKPLYAWDRDPQTRKKLLAAYPDRTVWFVKAPSVTHNGYQVAVGPLTAQEALGAVE